MKVTKSAIAIAVLMLASAAAQADSSGNTVTVGQIGSFNSATVEQTATSGDSVSINQSAAGDDPRYGFVANVTTVGGTGDTTVIQQNSWWAEPYSSVNVSQTGTSHERNYVTQSGGGDFSATITQTTSAYTGGPQYDTNTINQYSYIDSASISQQGGGWNAVTINQGSPSQSAIGNNATVNQWFESGDSATINQSAASNNATITQLNGYGNGASITQTAAFNTASITQSSSTGSTASITQSSADNLASVTQSASGSAVTVSQTGAFNTASIKQH
ncbi:hypothetical protein [Burkholderia contaminans]|uniref:Curlin associated protein n=1 Tax=Burkholderia contaminans TaxID=488447 RepID=A0A3N8PLX0_9BURK|nr:hypothetical protein [Burkholderia contaminans]RQT12707.1 hypothetical protein DF051_22830 [Burkholderia contaminans]